MKIIVCGNSAYESPDSTCYYFSAGPVAIGVWMDWVVEANLQV
jgi:hypothetical protein